MSQHGPPIPAAPFVAWLHNELDKLQDNQTIENKNLALAYRLDIGERRLRDYLLSRNGVGRPTDYFKRWCVENMLERAGVRLVDVYPDLPDDDIELESDAFCATCAQTVTPIGGICPWCESRPAPLLEAA